VTVTEPTTGRKHVVSAKTNDNTWSGTINVKSSEKNSNSTPWVEVPIPADPDLAGKKVTCDIALAVEYPAMSGSSSYTNHHSTMQRKVDVTLAPVARAGGQYNDWWWLWSVGAMGVVLVGSRLLIGSAKGLARKANPTRCMVPAGAGAGAAPPPPLAGGPGFPVSVSPPPPPLPRR
jgi:hypothetical protein